MRCWSSSRIQSSCAIPSSGDIRMSSAYSLSPPTSYLPLPTSYLLFLSLPTYVGGIRMSSAYSLSSPLCGGTHTRATCGFAGPSSDRMPECSARLDTALAPSPPPPARDRQRLTHHMHMHPHTICICSHTMCICIHDIYAPAERCSVCGAGGSPRTWTCTCMCMHVHACA